MQLPEAFVKSVEKILGEESAACVSAIANDAISSARINKSKLSDLFSEEEKIAWISNGVYLKDRPSFIADPSFHSGAYYVQESSSMFTAHAFRQITKTYDQPVRVLDLCAAPGGKSTLLLDEMSNDDLLVSNEIIKTRVNVLEENLVKWGRSNVVVTNNDPAQIGKLNNYFDIAVIDAPCSGEGMFRKDKKAIEEWSESHTEFCASRQKRILSDALTSLKPGGFLIYSTCTFNTKENEENVKWLIDGFNYTPIEINIEKDWGIEAVNSFENETLHAYRFYPHKVKGEGFFLACLQKPQERFEEPETKEVKTPRLKENELALLSPWIDDVNRYHFVFVQNNVTAYPKHLLNDIEFLKSRLYVKMAGIKMGESIKNNLVPDHQLALSIHKNDTISSIEVERIDALKFLRKETFFIPGYEQGIYLITYKNQGLGWIKALPNRFNNYLPVNLRILKDLNQLI